MSLSLPATLVKDGREREAVTANDYWSLVYQGYKNADSEEGRAELTPAQKRARTLAAKKAAQEQDTSSDGDGSTDTAGTASDGEGDLTDAGDPDQTA